LRHPHFPGDVHEALLFKIHRHIRIGKDLLLDIGLLNGLLELNRGEVSRLDVADIRHRDLAAFVDLDFVDSLVRRWHTGQPDDQGIPSPQQVAGINHPKIRRLVSNGGRTTSHRICCWGWESRLAERSLILKR